MKPKDMHHHCACCTCANQATQGPLLSGVTRRDFLFTAGALTVGGLAFSAVRLGAADEAAPDHRKPTHIPLKVQPVLTYHLPQRRQATSWREWGGLQTEKDVEAEKANITVELSKLAAQADFPLNVLPLATVQSVEQAAALAKGEHDVMLIYAAGGSGQILEALTVKEKRNLMFLRHQPGPVYLWYEIVHPRLLRKTVDEFSPSGLDVQDVVVDSQRELLERFRALHGLNSTLHKRIVAIGGPGGWGVGGQKAPSIARELWKLDIQNFPYTELAPRIQRARQNAGLVKYCEKAAGRYLAQSGVSLHTTRQFVNNAFVLCEVFKEILDESNTDALTINSCMGTIMPMSETTACLPLSLLNDEGYLAFCESDFVVIPSGILLHYISGKPVFLNDPTYPHDNVVTLAHCTAPRKMDGKNFERAKILTHFESDYGAAPKVEMKLNQKVTTLVPDFGCKKWVGFEGSIVGNPFLDICRSQIDVRVHGDGAALLEEMKGFHWMTSYGNYLGETGYALRKLGVEFHNLSAAKPT
jgi:hypothetical protein